MSPSEQTCRPSLIVVFFGLLLFGSASAAIVAEILRGLEFPVPGVMSASFVWMLCLLWVWFLVCTPVISISYSFKVTRRGIAGRTFWGRKRFLAWEDMNHVRRLGVPPFRFLRIRTNAGGPPMWLALFVSGRGQLAKRIAETVPEGHPILDFF